MSIRFLIDDSGSADFDVSDPGDEMLAGWLTADIGRVPLFALDALQLLDDVVNGRVAQSEYEGNFFTVYFREHEVKFFHNVMPDEEADYSPDHVREALERYWSFQATLPASSNMVRLDHPELPEWEADLLRWEKTWNRAHPYRGRLGIPSSGPS